MAPERRDRLASIRDELLNVKSSEFWEISDRGVNFDYLPPDRKEQLLTFFGWFEDLAGPAPRNSGAPHPTVSESAAVAPGQEHFDGPGAGRDPKRESQDVEPTPRESHPG